MTHRDNWGWRARIGMFIVSAEAVPEAEWWAMLPEGVSVHAARVTASTPWATWDANRRAVNLSADLERGAAQFASMQLSAVVIGHSSSSIVGGTDWDDAAIAKLQSMLPSRMAVTTNGQDCIAALRASNISRPFLVFPPWFGPSVLDDGTSYISAHGFNPSGRLQFDPGRQWRDIPPSELYANGLGFEQDVESLYRQVRQACPDNADGVLIVGTGFRCVGILAALEDDLGCAVVSANQASLWRCLRLSGVGTRVHGYGALLER
ncbi:MAG: hypothetical protein AAF493_05430 [Pseudomonadota bacterium]